MHILSIWSFSVWVFIVLSLTQNSQIVFLVWGPTGSIHGVSWAIIQGNIIRLRWNFDHISFHRYLTSIWGIFKNGRPYFLRPPNVLKVFSFAWTLNPIYPLKMVKIEKSIFLKNLSIKLSKSVKIRVLSRYSFERKIKSLFALNRFLSVNIGSLSKTKTSKVKLAPLFQIPGFEG